MGAKTEARPKKMGKQGTPGTATAFSILYTKQMT